MTDANERTKRNAHGKKNPLGAANRTRFRTERDWVMYWLIKYDRLPPGFRRHNDSSDWIPGLLLCLPLYAYGFYKILFL
jgi:hypothetical protein